MRIFALILTALAVATPALAESWNIRQLDTGTVWSDQNSNTVGVGDTGLTVEMGTVSTSSTEYVATHKPGRLTKAYIVTRSQGTGTSILSFGIMNGATTTGVFADITGTVSGSASGTNTLTVVDATGVASSVTFANVGDTNIVGAGDVISIHTDGGQTAGSDDTATIILVIE